MRRCLGGPLGEPSLTESAATRWRSSPRSPDLGEDLGLGVFGKDVEPETASVPARASGPAPARDLGGGGVNVSLGLGGGYPVMTPLRVSAVPCRATAGDVAEACSLPPALQVSAAVLAGGRVDGLVHLGRHRDRPEQLTRHRVAAVDARVRRRRSRGATRLMKL